MGGNISDKLKTIATLRETKGKEQETLKLISEFEEETQKSKNWKILVTLNWEKALVWQHIAMSEEAKETPDTSIILDAISKMEDYSLGADKLINKHDLEDKKATSHRFLGQLYRYKRDYVKAEMEYTAGISIFEGKQDVSALELKGFLACTMVLNSKVDEGVALAIKTFEEFDTDPAAIKLMEEDYYKWAVWKSGIIPRLVKALWDNNIQFDKVRLDKYLQESESVITNPKVKVTWGDDKFKFRVDEIAKTRSVLEKLMASVLAFVSAHLFRF
ncbi:MAG: hypothetical protein ACD_22C00082G0002 [uncultured bacterium]|nr:MAG: hypothetical protein ACD_22C00082G0002 [uncultured bacterium]